MTSQTKTAAAMTNEEAFSLAKHRGRYGHYDSIVFRDRTGGWLCQRYGREAIKNAMLAVGTGGKFYVVNAKWNGVVRWAEACIRFRSARFIEA